MLGAYYINGLPMETDLETCSSSLAISQSASAKTDSSRSLSTVKTEIEEIKRQLYILLIPSNQALAKLKTESVWHGNV